MTLDVALRAELDRLEQDGLRRARQAPTPPGAVDFCTNDYLGYAGRPVSRETIPSGAAPGAGASRLIFGTNPEHVALEAELADWMGSADALAFASGYAANVGALSALVRPGDFVVSDRLNHASLIDGCRLARANISITAHLDVAAVEAALRGAPPVPRWVVTESCFSMDGDSPDLAALRELCDRHSANLYVDEAHGIGVYGPEGAGLMREAGVRADVLVGTFGKAVGVHGAFVAGSATLTEFLWNRARSFVFSTATSPLTAAVTLERVRQVRRDDAGRLHLRRLFRLFREALAGLPGAPLSEAFSPLVPIMLGSSHRATAVAAALRDQGFLVQAIRPPTVPPDTARLRIALHANHTEDQVVSLARALRQVCGNVSGTP